LRLSCDWDNFQSNHLCGLSYETKNQITLTEAKRQHPKSLDQLTLDIGDFSDLSKHDAALKFWLPEPVKDALSEISESTEQSVSGFLRQFLIIHTYGLYPYLVMLDAMPNFCRHDDRSSVKFSKNSQNKEGKVRVSTYWIADLGKNIAPIKIWVPTRLKQDLALLADHTELTPSNYIREIVISRLLGHGMLPKRPEMMYQPTNNLEKWLEEKELDWVEVEENVFNSHHIIKETRNEWVKATDSQKNIK